MHGVDADAEPPAVHSVHPTAPAKGCRPVQFMTHLQESRSQLKGGFWMLQARCRSRVLGARLTPLLLHLLLMTLEKSLAIALS